MDGTAVYNLLLRRLGLGLLSKGGRGGEAAAPPPPSAHARPGARLAGRSSNRFLYGRGLRRWTNRVRALYEAAQWESGRAFKRSRGGARQQSVVRRGKKRSEGRDVSGRGLPSPSLLFSSLRPHGSAGDSPRRCEYCSGGSRSGGKRHGGERELAGERGRGAGRGVCP